MAINSLATLISAKKQKARWLNSTTFSVTTNVTSSLFRTLAGANTANGIATVMADWLTPNDYAFTYLDSFNGANGYLTKFKPMDGGSSGTIILFDQLFKAGSYAFNAATALTAQPSYASRVPGGTDFTNTEIWLEAATAFTGNATVAVTYTNESGVAGRSTGTVAFGVAPGIRRMLRFPLQAGDTGVQKIESVTSTVATVGTFNILVLRRLAMSRTQPRSADSTTFGYEKDILKLGMPQVFENMCPFIAVMSDSAATTGIIADVEIASG